MSVIDPGPAADAPADAVAGPAVRLAQVECEARLEAGQPMPAVDRYIDELPLAEAQRDQVRLFAWAYGARVPPR